MIFKAVRFTKGYAGDTANCTDAALIHEAAIGKIAEEQIISGFLK